MSVGKKEARRKGGWGVPVALLALGAPPLIAGALRLVTLAGVAEIMPVSEARAAMPVPVVVHIIGSAVFAVLGALQFAAGFRRRRPGWHRAAGRVVVVGGLVAGLSGLWLALFYPRGQHVGDLLTGFRVVFGSAMVASTVLGLVTIRRGDVRRHRAWMTRAYALGLGAGTQMFTGMVASFIVSPPTELSRALQDGAGWAINLAVAEWVIRRRLAGQDHWGQTVKMKNGLTGGFTSEIVPDRANRRAVIVLSSTGAGAAGGEVVGRHAFVPD